LRKKRIRGWVPCGENIPTRRKREGYGQAGGRKKTGVDSDLGEKGGGYATPRERRAGPKKGDQGGSQ